MRSGSIGLTVVRVALAMVLFLAGVPRPRRSEEILHWIVAVFALYLVYRAYQYRRFLWVLLWLGVVICFNPLLPIRMSRETEIRLEYATGALLLLSVLLMDRGDV
jgi:hypothetical protein